MSVKEVPQRVWRGRRTVVRLQRDLWLAQLAFWPAVVVSVILLSVATWALWRRKSRPPQPEVAAPVTDSSPAATPRAQGGLSG